MTINEIAKEAIEIITKNHEFLTPDNYYKAFCFVAKKRGYIVEDCQKVENYIKKLDPVIQNEAKKFFIKTVDDFFSFLVAYINRSTSLEANEHIKHLTLLIKRLLQAITLLHDKEASELANISLDKISYTVDTKAVDLIKDKWFSFITSYDDSYLNKLDRFCKINKSDLRLMVENLIECFLEDENKASKEIYSKIAPLLIAALSPSIASDVDEELAVISYELQNSPQSLATESFIEDIKKMILRRKELDKSKLKENVAVLDKLLEDISFKIINLLKRSNISHDKIKQITVQIKNMEFKDDSLETIQKKLLKIAQSLEIETDSFSTEIQNQHNLVKALYQKVKKLEKALQIAKREIKIDFLTSALSKRGFEEELKRAEESFKRYGTNYSICFFDIDYFKIINDTYGHDAGDVILKSVGEIFKRYTREVDIVGRYGGEEFVVVLPNIDLTGAIKFANKIRKIIKSNRFIYKGERIDVSISGGVSERKDYRNLEEAINAADEMLYKAKNSGRNRIMPEFG